jgi:RNA polymerase sigma-70 factor (ECF subfamily)
MVSKFPLNRHETEDIVQEAFIKLYLQLESGGTIQYPKTWLYKVATNICLNTVTRRKETQLLEVVNDSELGECDSFESEIENNEQECNIKEALLNLKEHERLIVILYSEGLSYKEIAEISGVRFSSVSKSLSRALEKLKPLLKNQYYEMLNQ